MDIRRIIKATIAALLLCISMTHFTAVSAGDEDIIAEQIAEFRKSTRCGSVSAVVCNSDNISFYGGRDSLYQIGSMTKAFTGLAVQKLICEHLISGDDTVSGYIPGFTVYYNNEEAAITIDDLMSQRSGFTNSEKDYPAAAPDMTLREWAYSISGKELKSAPGEKYAYANTNYDLLGAVIEEVTGMTYREYMEREIFAPLGLVHTYAGIPSSQENIIPGTRLGFGCTFPFDMPVSEAAVPAGYFYSDAEDMGRWIRIWLGLTDIPEDFSAPLEQIRSRVRQEGDYYAGWECFRGGITGHSGGTAAYSSRIAFSGSENIGVCVLTSLNVAASTDSLCDSILQSEMGNSPSALKCDVWTVFDRVFSALCAAGAVFFVCTIRIRNRRTLIICAVSSFLLLAAILAVFPTVFGADMHEILFVWAPWSVSGFIMILTADILCICIRIIQVRKHDNREKTSQRSAAEGCC